MNHQKVILDKKPAFASGDSGRISAGSDISSLLGHKMTKKHNFEIIK